MLFPKSTLSAVTGQFADPALLAKNATLEKKLGATLDALADISENLASLEEYLQLNIPQMEDGNNFGVTVQLSAQAILKHAQEDLGNDLEDLLKVRLDDKLGRIGRTLPRWTNVSHLFLLSFTRLFVVQVVPCRSLGKMQIAQQIDDHLDDRVGIRIQGKHHQGR